MYDASASLIARVRTQLSTLDRAVPTMELAMALRVSASSASRLLADIEAVTGARTFAELRAATPLPAAALVDQIINSRGWDDAVFQLESAGQAPADARAAVDRVVLDLAMEAFSRTPVSDD